MLPNISPGRANTSVGTPRSCFIITSRSHGFFVRQISHFSANERCIEYHGDTSTVLMSGKSVPYTSRPANSGLVSASFKQPGLLICVSAEMSV